MHLLAFLWPSLFVSLVMVLTIDIILVTLFFLVIAVGNTFVMHAYFFPLTSLFLAQDVFNGVVTHLGATHTHFKFSYASFGLVMDTLVSIVTH